MDWWDCHRNSQLGSETWVKYQRIDGISTWKKEKKKKFLHKEKKIPESQGWRPLYTSKWNISSIQGIENNNTNSPFPPNFVKYLLFAIFVSDPLFGGGQNIDLAKAFFILCHYPSSAEVTTILNSELLLLWIF